MKKSASILMAAALLLRLCSGALAVNEDGFLTEPDNEKTRISLPVRRASRQTGLMKNLRPFLDENPSYGEILWRYSR